MITPEQKIQIARLVALEAEGLGWKKTAVKYGVNQNTLRYNMQQREKWGMVSDAMWVKIAGRSGYKLNEVSWNLVPTTNSRIMFEYLHRAQNEQLFMAISNSAGSGKSAGVAMYRMEYQGVLYLECEESWSHKRFVQKLAEMLGIKYFRVNVSVLTDQIVHELKQKAATTRPLLIIDEANKLKPASLRLFIPLFNYLADEIGMVLIGAHDLRQHIQAGVRRDARGFDELESRLGRSYMSLFGIMREDVENICVANGLTNEQAIENAWQKLRPEKHMIDGVYYWLATHDLRVLKQAVKYELNRLRIAANGSAPAQGVAMSPAMAIY